MPDEHTTEHPDLVVVSDYVCPFCYLAEPALARLRGEEGVEAEYRAYELRPAPTPLLDPGGEYLTGVWADTVEPLAEALDVEITRPPVQPRSRKAHEAAAFARDHGRFGALHERLFAAFFNDGRDIGRVDVLVELGEEVGLDRTELKVALDIDQYTERVVADERRARRVGVTGVPTFRAGGESLVGLQPYDVLREFACGEP